VETALCEANPVRARQTACFLSFCVPRRVKLATLAFPEIYAAHYPGLERIATSTTDNWKRQ
jgi:hypothetical protein